MKSAGITELGNMIAYEAGNPQGHSASSSPRDVFSKALENAGGVRGGDDTMRHPMDRQMSGNSREMSRNSDTTAKTDTAANSKISSEKKEDVTAADKNEATATNDVKDNVDTEKAGQEAAATGQVEENEEAALEQVAEELVKEAAKILGVDPDALTEALDGLGLATSDLLDPQNVNLLVANVAGDGDVMNLMTDSNLSDMALDLNRMVGEIVAQLEENFPEMDVKAAFSEILDELDLSALNEEMPDVAVVQNVPDMPEEEAAFQEQAGQQMGNKPENGFEAMKDAAGDEAAVQFTDKEKEDGRFENLANFAPKDAQPVVTEDMVNELTRSDEAQRYVTDPQEILDQIADHIKTNVKEYMTSVDMVLHPASLGHVALNIASQDGNITARFTAQNEDVRAALEGQIMILKQNLEQQGVKVEAVEVTVSSHAFEQNLEQGNEQNEAQNEEQEKLRRATRKIDLGNMGEDGLGLEDLTESELVEVEMMQADGRKMDYKA